MRKGLSLIKKIYWLGGKTYLASQLFKIKKEIKYTKTIPIGYTDYPLKEETFNINFTNTNRILILGGTGSGKSWLSRAIMNRAYMAGLSPIVMTDIAPEYFSSRYPLQEEFKKFLYKNEESVPMPMKVYYPYFLYKFFKFDIPEQILFQFDITKIHPSDIVGFINYEELSLTAKLEIEDLISEMIRNKKNFTSIDDLISFINKKTISTITKQTLIKTLNNLKNLDVFGNTYASPDLIEDINNNLIPDINMFGWQRTDFKKYIALYITLTLREILVARQLKKLKADKHILILFEELHEFAPKKGDKTQEIVKREIEKITFEGRKEGISFIFITQNPETISPSIIEQCDYIFIPRGFERVKLMTLVKNILPSYYEYPYDFGIEMARTLSVLRKWKDGMREWLVLERGGEITRIAPLSPLSAHRLEGQVF